MICHVEIWKQELIHEAEQLRIVTSLTERGRRPANNYIAYAAIEKFAFTSAYYIRKLIEAKQLSDELESTPIDLLAYPVYIGRIPVDEFSSSSLSEYYNFRKAQQIRILLEKYCNLLIHSFLFAIRFQKDNARIFFNSDKTKDSTLYEVSLQRLIEIAEASGKDQIRFYMKARIGPGIWKVKNPERAFLLRNSSSSSIMVKGRPTILQLFIAADAVTRATHRRH
jgi:hypothetical protein